MKTLDADSSIKLTYSCVNNCQIIFDVDCKLIGKQTVLCHEDLAVIKQLLHAIL